ncbi:hypothetical protein [Nocardia callitridis]|uniref:Uncharacterized protein n=1 Tax=Nocardia callitridis TaxID=648753 RepID=A0ABP9K3A9_9NOCA
MTGLVDHDTSIRHVVAPYDWDVLVRFTAATVVSGLAATLVATPGHDDE